VSGKILVVDDEPDILNLVKMILKKEGYVVSTASNGKEFMEKMTPNPGLIIMDDVMPVKRGIELCQEIKREKTTQHIPVIIFSASGSIEKKEAAFKAGADGFLLKPFTIKELTSIVNKHYKINNRTNKYDL